MYGSKVRQLRDLIQGLDPDRFNVDVAALSVGDEATDEIKALGVECSRMQFFPPRSFQPKRALGFLASPYQIRRGRYDLVHSLCYQSIFTDVLLVKWFSSAKYLYTKTNLEWDNHPWNWTWKTRLADRAVSISTATHELLEQKGFGHKATKIYLGIDTAAFTFSGEKRSELREKWSIPVDAVVFGCAAWLVEWKDHIGLITAFEKVSEERSDVYLLFCGGNHRDEYYRRFLQRVAHSPASGRIRVLGTVSDMQAFYSAIDCFVLPSRNEPFGYVYVEAMSCRRPAIACRAGGPLDIIQDEETGFLVDIGAYDDLATKMLAYAASPSLRSSHGEAARRRVTKVFANEVMAEAHEELYEELLSAE